MGLSLIFAEVPQVQFPLPTAYYHNPNHGRQDTQYRSRSQGRRSGSGRTYEWCTSRNSGGRPLVRWSNTSGIKLSKTKLSLLVYFFGFRVIENIRQPGHTSCRRARESANPLSRKTDPPPPLNKPACFDKESTTRPTTSTLVALSTSSFVVVPSYAWLF